MPQASAVSVKHRGTTKPALPASPLQAQVGQQAPAALPFWYAVSSHMPIIYQHLNTSTLAEPFPQLDSTTPVVHPLFIEWD